VTVRSSWLLAGGGLSLAASLLHVGCIFGGAFWYRFLGAGEGMARAAERGSIRPALITALIAAVLAAWAAYAFSGAGLIGRLPFLKAALVTITVVYLLRGMVLFVPSALGRPDLSPGFLFWSSLIVLAVGLIHAVGTWRTWSML
jgi:hypothetical protein